MTADELSGNLPESSAGAGGGLAATSAANAQAEVAGQEPTAAPPWTHMLDGCKARVLSPRGEPGDELHIEVLVPEGEPAPGVERRTMLQSEWDERAEAVPFTVDQAEAEGQAPLPAPWTHTYKGLRARVTGGQSDEKRGPVVVIECEDGSTRTLNQATWDKESAPLTAEEQVAEARQAEERLAVETTVADVVREKGVAILFAAEITPAPWTHTIEAVPARLVEDMGDKVVFDRQRADGKVERRMEAKAAWEEKAVPVSAEPAGGSESAEVPSEPTLTELASLVGVELEELADESFIVRGKDLPKGGLFVEPDKIRAILEGIRDGNWRDV